MVGVHWAKSDCDAPELTEKQHEMVTGLLMGDGSLNFANKNPYLEVGSVNYTFLKGLFDNNYIASNIHLSVKYEQSCKVFKDSGLGSEHNLKNYHDIYRLQFHSIPAFSRYKKWYSTGDKLYPGDLSLTPKILKMWFVGDGSIDTNGKRPRLIITKNVGNDRTEHLLQKIFGEYGWEMKRNSGNNILFNVDDSAEMWKYMGDPPPGFAYKWPGGPSYKEAMREHATQTTSDDEPISTEPTPTKISDYA